MTIIKIKISIPLFRVSLIDSMGSSMLLIYHLSPKFGSRQSEVSGVRIGNSLWLRGDLSWPRLDQPSFPIYTSSIRTFLFDQGTYLDSISSQSWTPIKPGVPFTPSQTFIKTNSVEPLTMTVDHQSPVPTTTCRVRVLPGVLLINRPGLQLPRLQLF